MTQFFSIYFYVNVVPNNSYINRRIILLMIVMIANMVKLNDYVNLIYMTQFKFSIYFYINTLNIVPNSSCNFSVVLLTIVITNMVK